MSSRSPITRWLGPRRMVTIVVLVAVWCGLWGTVSVANVASGLVVAVAVLATGFGSGVRGAVRPVPLARLVWLVAVDLVRSTYGVASEVITPTDHTREAIIGVELPPDGRAHTLLLTVAITLTPGTAVVDADPENDMLYLHLLHVERRAEVEAHTKRLAHLACAALPTRTTAPA